MPIPTKKELLPYANERGVLIAAVPLDGSAVEVEFEPFLTDGGWNEYSAQMVQFAKEEIAEKDDYGWMIARLGRLGALLEDPGIPIQWMDFYSLIPESVTAEQRTVFTSAQDAACISDQRGFWVRPEPRTPKKKAAKPKVKVKAKSAAAAALAETDNGTVDKPKGTRAQADLKARLKAKAAEMAGEDAADLVEDKVIVA